MRSHPYKFFHRKIYSDIDIGIAGLDKLLQNRFIADLSGPVDPEVDVIRLEDCSFAETVRTQGIRWKKEI